MSSRSDLPQDIAACHALIDQQQATIDRLSADMALLKRALFGRRRERFVDDPRQTYLFDSTQQNADEASAEPKPDGRRSRTTRLGRRAKAAVAACFPRLCREKRSGTS